MVRERRFMYFGLKRLIDLMLGSVFFLLALPLIAIACIAIRQESRGNPLFLQRRIGLHGKMFTIFKLRGMWIDASELFPEMYNYTKHSNLDFKFHHESDPRVTKVGNFIRRTSIDELPNFLNVLLGNMTLVGPRPEIPDVLSLYGKYTTQYISVRPGITCLSKVSGRDYLSKEETIRLDLEYVDSMCLLLDLKILWRTFVSVIGRKDVFGRNYWGPHTLLNLSEDSEHVTDAVPPRSNE
jgi:lipopolysaccharide/colanic/teichoic acid biosynthesis glycosyltransferase